MPLGRIVAGLDVGTTKVTTIIAEVDESESVSVIGFGQTESRGVERGMIVNLDETVDSIQKSVERAQHMAGCRISSVYVGIGGEHIRGINSHAAVTVGKITNEISEEDVKRVIDHAQNVSMPADMTVIHVIPQEYRVDDQKHIIQPIGLAGSRLEGEVHIVRGAATAEQNLRRAVQRAGLQVAGIVIQPLASALAVLSPDEQEWGVAMLDIGGGTTDIAVYHRRCIRHTAVLSIGSAYVTSDIAIGCSILMSEAEQLKKQYGRASRQLAEQENNLPEDPREQPDIRFLRENTRAVLDAKIPEPKFSVELARIIELRMVELLGAAWFEIRKSGHQEYLASGVVVTGGGAMVKGAAELAQRVFGVPVRIGYPLGVGGIRESVATPANATGVGLVLFGASQLLKTPQTVSMTDAEKELERLNQEMQRKPLEGMRRWLKEFFA